MRGEAWRAVPVQQMEDPFAYSSFHLFNVVSQDLGNVRDALDKHSDSCRCVQNRQ
jgi:hypothetical protein